MRMLNRVLTIILTIHLVCVLICPSITCSMHRYSCCSWASATQNFMSSLTSYKIPKRQTTLKQPERSSIMCSMHRYSCCSWASATHAHTPLKPLTSSKSPKGIGSRETRAISMGFHAFQVSKTEFLCTLMSCSFTDESLDAWRPIEPRYIFWITNKLYF